MEITLSNGDQNKLFNIVNTLLGRKQLVLPDYNDPITLVSTFNMCFIDKITNIRVEFPLLESSLPPYSFESTDSIMSYCTVLLESFTMITSEELINIVSVIYKTTCSSEISHSSSINNQPGLDPQVLKTFLSFLFKLIEKVISSRILKHISDNDLIEKIQSAYRCGKNCFVTCL